MKLTPEIIYGFTKHYLLSNFDNPQPIPDFHVDLWTLCCSTNKRVSIAAPRSHAKSTSVTHSYGLASVLFRAKSHVIIASNTEGQARNFLKDMAMELHENEELIADFKIKKFHKDTETEIIVEMGDDGHLFRILAKGSEQKVRGEKWRNKRPDLIIGDDLENDDIVMNEERRLKFKQWFFNALVPCLSDEGEIRIVGTILHLDSLLETLMPKADKEGKYKIVDTPLAEYSTDPSPQWYSVRFRAHDPTFDHILWPERFNKKRLLMIKADYVAQGFPEGYSQEYLNYPVDESTAYFRRNDLLPMEEVDWKKPLRYYVGGDLAISKNAGRDYTAFVVVGVDSEGIIHVVDVRKGRWDTYEIVDEAITIAERYKPEVFLFEAGAIFKAIEPVLLKEMYKPGKVVSFNYDTVAASKEKTVRNRALQHRTRAGKVKFDKDAEWYPDTELELLRFPRGAHDDVVDSMGHICNKVLHLINAPTTKQIRQRERKRDLKASRVFIGRSKRTGY